MVLLLSRGGMSRREQFLQLRAAAPQILPSLLLCDFGNLEREVARLEAAGVRGLHLDVMDGNFVPNLTYGMPVVEALRRLTSLPLDAHLMIANPGAYVEPFRDAGADAITFHVEACQEPGGLLERIRGLGVAAGIALNPSTPLTSVEPFLDQADLVLVMSVEAGFGGQSFHPSALERLRRLRTLAGPRLLLEVDGGINEQTIAASAASGAQLLVVGSAIFGQPAYEPVVRHLSNLAGAGARE